MKTYHGERTDRGCTVTVDGVPLAMRSNLSGNATTEFDWGYVGTGQLAVALLSDLLGDDAKAKAMCETFEREVVAAMPYHRWTMTDNDLAAALAPLVGVDGARVGYATADAPSAPQPDAVAANDAAAIASTAGERRELIRLDQAVVAADAASARTEGARQATRAGDTPADEAMSTANRAVDQNAYSATRAANGAATLAREAADDAKRAASSPPPPARG